MNESPMNHESIKWIMNESPMNMNESNELLMMSGMCVKLHELKCVKLYEVCVKRICVLHVNLYEITSTTTNEKE